LSHVIPQVSDHITSKHFYIETFFRVGSQIPLLCRAILSNTTPCTGTCAE
jgi:hypothetical protein